MGNKTALSSNEGQIDADNTVCAEKPVKKKRKFRREWLWCWIVVSIPIVGYIFFNAFPVAISPCVDVYEHSTQPNFDDEVE